MKLAKYHSGNKINGVEIGGECGTYKCEENCIEVLVWKYKGMKELERSKHRWENNIKIGLKEIRFEEVDTIESKQEQLKGCHEHGNEI
jgi:hypothetical protein